MSCNHLNLDFPLPRCSCHVTCECRVPGAKCHKLPAMPVPQAPVSPPPVSVGDYCVVWGKTGFPCNDPLCLICTKAKNERRGTSAPIGGVDAKATGTKLDSGKVRFDLVPMRAFTEYGKVLTFGAVKYGANNWRKVVGWRWRYVGAGIRHIVSYMLGERNDPESGLHHLGHALCCFNFVLDNELSIEEGIEVPDGDAIPPKVDPNCVVCKEPMNGFMCSSEACPSNSGGGDE